MTADFDWSGAPEGERWETDYAFWVVAPSGGVYHKERSGYRQPKGQGFWQGSLGLPSIATRVESARPVPRVGDRVRVSYEGVVTHDDTLEFVARDAHGTHRAHPSNDPKLSVEVLGRADPPLQPGDLVRDGEGGVYEYHDAVSRPFKAVLHVVPLRNEDGDIEDDGWRSRDELTGPLVKVQLMAVEQ